MLSLKVFDEYISFSEGIQIIRVSMEKRICNWVILFPFLTLLQWIFCSEIFSFKLCRELNTSANLDIPTWKLSYAVAEFKNWGMHLLSFTVLIFTLEKFLLISKYDCAKMWSLLLAICLIYSSFRVVNPWNKKSSSKDLITQFYNMYYKESLNIKRGGKVYAMIIT